MEISSLLHPDLILAGLQAENKKQLLRQIAEAAALRLNLNHQIVFEALLRRERLGTTGVGQGIAIPHARLDGLDRPRGVFIHLAQPVDFEAVDDQPVDLVFALFAPEDAGADHLNALVLVSRILRNDWLIAQLRRTRNPQQIHDLLSAPHHLHAA